MAVIENDLLKLAFDFVQYTHHNVFLTGKAGTGKTTFLQDLRNTCPKRMVVVAPTGVAAINAGGVTMHSFFQLSFGPQISHLIDKTNKINNSKNEYVKKFNKEKIRLIKCLDLLVIDEISMVRADMLDAVDEVLRRYRNNSNPFGGVQLLLIGDLFQLSPVIKEDEWQLLKEHYNTVYFFDSKALQKTTTVNIELKHIFRQTDAYFINMLGKIRNNDIDNTLLDEINTRYIPDFNPREEDGYIILTTHNAQAQNINLAKLNQLKSDSSTFKATIEGEFQSYNFPTEEKLVLKEGAQVMFVKNDSKREKQYYNGKIGKLISIEDDVIIVKSPEDETLISVERETWHNVKYSLNDNTKEVDENIIGSFSQYPLKLAWAITIHKSQGLTFDKAIIDAGASFAFGQVYVALSRCRRLEGIVLRSPITRQCIKNDRTVADFTDDISRNIPGKKELLMAKIDSQRTLLFELIDFSLLNKLIFKLNRYLNQNSNIIQKQQIEEISTIETYSKNEIFNVAQKFALQLNSILPHDVLPEQDIKTKERIEKASEYFSQKIKNLSKQFDKLGLDTDNKVVNKSIDEYIESIYRELYIKKQCFKVCEKGFDAIKYIKTKANADIDFKPFTFKKKSKQVKINTQTSHPELFNLLKYWRHHTASEMNLPVYMILPQKSLMDIIEELPQSPKELLKIKGIGKKKAKQFGNDILDIIIDYCKENI